MKTAILLPSSLLLLSLGSSMHSVQGFAQPTSFILRKTPSSTSSSSLYDNDKKTFSIPDIDLSSIGESLSNFDVDRVVSNVKGNGEPLGSRGEFYVAAQGVLLICILIGGIPYAGPAFQFIGGPGLLLGGSVVIFKAFTDLGSDSLSPFPAPVEGATLKTEGIYGQMRNPMYTGLLMLMAGLSIATNSADRLILTALLWYLLDVKAEKEEVFLTEMYGQEYIDYKAAVPGKFVPADLLEDMPWNQK